MTKPNLSRRGFLKKTGLSAASAVALTLTGVSLSPSAWSMTLSNIDLETGRTLSRLCRVLYPHNHLDDMYYDACVEGLDAKAKSDQNLLKLLKQGVATLNKGHDKPFLKLSASQQLAAVQQIEGTPLFNLVRGHVVVALYNNDKIWDSFGYQGPSFPYGGYLERGFNDINWLAKH